LILVFLVDLEKDNIANDSNVFRNAKNAMIRMNGDRQSIFKQKDQSSTGLNSIEFSLQAGNVQQ